MRKGFDGLSGIVSGQLKGNPCNGDVFIFVNRVRNKIKLLHWESEEFGLYYKRLECGTFDIPVTEGLEQVQLRWTELVLMMEGIKGENIHSKNVFLLHKDKAYCL